ncbi:ubiquitin carboxyl-terminal hydrolase [Endogone sp. FLAS-F59071]|nr:ubiquitin carboxyl-terminal hydrolase [Endogone sp. FLAS-F59071]|eukprot:RUS21118.1 ubiquitin carboxyl-terminal hydrolase [Endogone sp. FLAS-F59071]
MYTDVLVLDESYLSTLPQPVLAVLLLFPVTEQSEKARLEQEAEVTKREQFISPNLIFFRQTISNACGTIALLHSVTNNEQVIDRPHQALSLEFYFTHNSLHASLTVHPQRTARSRISSRRLNPSPPMSVLSSSSKTRNWLARIVTVRLTGRHTHRVRMRT